MLTELQAVNEMLAEVPVPDVSAVPGTAGSIEARANARLDEASRRIQREGWFQNRTFDRTLAVPTITIGTTGGAGTFVFDETVTGGTSTATAKFGYVASGVFHLSNVSGTFQNAETITGGTSGATRTTNTAPAAITAGDKLALDSSWILVEPARSRIGRERLVFSIISTEGLFLRDIKNTTTTFTEDQRVDIIKLLDFANISDSLQAYIVALAKLNFIRQLKPEAGLDHIVPEFRQAKLQAHRENNSQRDSNVLLTPEFCDFRADEIRPTILHD